jgi:hypothetical protein
VHAVAHKHEATGPWKGAGDEEQTRKDISYSPGSDTETQRLQNDPPAESPAMDDVDAERVRNLPGTGGPDDTGDVAPAQDEPLR